MTLFRRLISGCVFVAACLGAGETRASDYPLVDKWTSALGGLECKERHGPVWSPSPDGIWLAASAFAGQSLGALAVRAGYADAPAFLADGGQLSGRDDAKALMENILAASPDVTARMLSEVQAHGRALCLPIQALRAAGFRETVRLQLNERDYWQPHAELAQVMINLRRCGPVGVDGFFGPASRAAWSASGLPLSAGQLPSPGDVVRLARAPAGCDAAAPAHHMVALISACLTGGFEDGPNDPAAVLAEIDALVSAAPDEAVQRIEPMLALCHRNDPYMWSLFPATSAIVARMVATEAGTVSTPEDAARLARSVPERFFRGSEAEGEFLDGVGHALWSRYGDTGLGWAGLEMLLRAQQDHPYLNISFDGVSDQLKSPAAADLARRILSARLDWADPFPGYRPGTQPEYLSHLPPILEGIVLEMDAKRTVLDAANAMDREETLRQAALAEDRPTLHYTYATLVMEGFTVKGRRPDVARRHFEAAAASGYAPAQFRLGLMVQHGVGGPQDAALAQDLFQQAADSDLPEALLLLAAQQEQSRADWPQAKRLYARALPKMDTDAAALAIFGRMIADTGFWEIGQPGYDLLVDGARQAQLPDDRENWEFPGERWRAIAGQLGAQFADAQSGLLMDLPRAARWWRVAQDDRLAALVAQYPELAATPDELAAKDGSDTGLRWIDFSSADSMAASLERSCVYGIVMERDCAAQLQEAALGMKGPGMIAPAYAALRDRSDRELAEQARRGGLAPFVPSESDEEKYSDPVRRPVNTIAMIDLLTFFGDYAGALQRLGGISTVDDAFLSHSLGPLRRQIARVREGQADGAAIMALLQGLRARGDATATQLVDVLKAPVQHAAPDQIDRLRARYDRVAHLSASRALANVARDLGRAEEAGGNTDRAVELELIAMRSDMRRHDATQIASGPIAAELARVCTLSRSSERLFALGSREVALTLAKDAVNRLQGLRADLAGLPEDLQLCFRDQVESHYRWLADLFIAENRPDEASRVLEMLKSYETYQFASRAAEKLGEDAFDRLPVMAQERRLIEAMEQVGPAVTALSAQRARLVRASNARDLTAVESAELERLNASIAAAAEQRENVRSELVAAAEALGRGDAELRLDPGKSIKRYLRRQRDGRAVILQYVVLPDRMGAVLTTPNAQIVRSWDRLAGETFSETALNAVIDRFRAQVQNPGQDPRALARQIHDFLLPLDLMQEIEATGADTIILSADRQLRYVPFAALHDGETWLAQRFTISHTAVGTPSVSPVGQVERIAAFGMSRPADGFSALPEVRAEVETLVRQSRDDPGILSGTAALDGAFTRDRFVQSLVFSDADTDRLGVVHLASHFKFGATEEDSFLLLGDGGRLSVAEFRTGFGIDQDLADVALLTLSACETAYGATDADGRELESFAAVARYQGAQNVLATLWPVADASTAALMVAVYDQIRQGVPVSQAVTEAQRRMLQADFPDQVAQMTRGAFSLSPPGAGEGRPLDGLSHPFYWAPFVVLEGSV